MSRLISSARTRNGVLARLLLGATMTLALSIAGLFGLAWGLGPVSPADGADAPDCVGTLAAVNGRGSAEGPSGAFRLEELSADGEALLVCRLGSAFAADAWPILQFRADDFPPNYVLLLGWRRSGTDAPAPVRLQAPRGELQTYFLADHPEWRGRVTELALYLYPQEPAGTGIELGEPMRIETARLAPDGLVARIRAMGTSWFGADPWNHRSLNTLGVHVDLLELRNLNVALIGLWILACIVFTVVFAARDRLTFLRIAALAALPPALIAQGHWLDSLAWQRSATHELFGGLTPIERRYRQYDGDLAAMADRLKALISQGDRVFVRASEPLVEQRIAWFLRPRNVALGLPPIGTWRSGDFVVLHDDEQALERARRGRFPNGRDPVDVSVELQDGDTAVLRVR